MEGRIPIATLGTTWRPRTPLVATRGTSVARPETT
jgi:hypothetical protein